MTNSGSPLIRLIHLVQKRLKLYQRKRDHPTPVPDVADQIREEWSSKLTTVAPLPSPLAAKSIHDQSHDADSVHPTVAAASEPSVPSEDALEAPKLDNLAIVRTEPEVASCGESRVPTTIALVSEASDSLESSGTIAGERRVPLLEAGNSDGSHAHRLLQRRIKQFQRHDAHYNPNALRRMFRGTPILDQPRNSPTRQTIQVAPPSGAPTAGPHARGRPSLSLSATAGRQTSHTMELCPGSPAILSIDNCEFLVRFECIIENSSNLFPGLDIGGNIGVRIDPFGSISSGFHRTVAVGTDLWLIRIITQIIASSNTTRFQTPPTINAQTPDIADAGDRLQGHAHHPNYYSENSCATVHMVAQPPMDDNSQRLGNTPTRQRQSFEDEDPWHVDPQHALHNQGHAMIDDQTLSIKYHDPEPGAFAQNAHHFLAPHQAPYLNPVRGSPRLPIEQALSRSLGQVPWQPDDHAQNYVPIDVQASPAKHYHNVNGTSTAIFSPSPRYASIPSILAPPSPTQQSPRPQFTRVLTESPIPLSFQQEVNFISTPGANPNIMQTEQLAPQAPQAPKPSGAQPPPAPFGLTLANGQSPTQETYAAQPASPLWPPGLRLPKPRLATPPFPAFMMMQGPQTLSPAKPFAQQSPWMNHLDLTPAGYPDPVQTPPHAPIAWPPSTPLAVPPDFVPVHHPPPGQVRRKTIRRPSP